MTLPTGTGPPNLAIDPTGTWLYVANERSGTLAWFPVDAETGTLGPMAGSLPVPAVVQIRLD
nr:beta-propeller fold lactonase family protein [Actinoplanes bogorensis]